MTVTEASDFADEVRRLVGDSLRAEVHQEMEAIRAEHHRMVESQNKSMQDMAAWYTSHVQKQTSELQPILAALSDQVAATEQRATAAEQRLAKATVALEEQTKAQVQSLTESLAQEAKSRIEQITNTIDNAKTTVANAAKIKIEAEAERIAAEKAKNEATEAEANAHKAVQFMTLRGEREIERNIAEANLKAKEKRIYNELKAEREALTDHNDREDAIIERGINHFYPQMKERLEKLMQQTEENNAE